MTASNHEEMQVAQLSVLLPHYCFPDGQHDETSFSSYWKAVDKLVEI